MRYQVSVLTLLPIFPHQATSRERALVWAVQHKSRPRFEGVLTHLLLGPVVASHGAQDLVDMPPR